MIILGFYSVIAGWCMQYLVASVFGQIKGDSQAVTVYFQNFSSDPVRPLIWTVIFIVITHLIVIRGVRGGIEKFSNMLMPALFVLLIVIVTASCMLPGSMKGVEFLFKPDFSKVTQSVFLDSLGQAFFSLSLGTACLCTYASYFSRQTKMQITALQVTILDTLVAVMAGVMIFPAVFSFGIAPTAGPELVFITLPNVFQQLPMGAIWSLVFFLLLALAALTSTISLHEVATAYVHEEYQITRTKAAWFVSGGVMVLGILSSLSIGIWKEYTLFGLTFFDLLDYLTAKIMLPFGGMLICIYLGNRVDRKILKEELTNKGTVPFYFFNTYAFFMKYIAPIAIGMIFLNELGIIQWLMG